MFDRLLEKIKATDWIRPEFKKTGNKEFDDFVDAVYDDFEENQLEYLEQAQKLAPEANILAVDLSGGYGRGTPTPDSDVDLKIYHLGPLDGHKVRGKIVGYGGVFDIHPEKLETYKELPASPKAFALARY